MPPFQAFRAASVPPPRGRGHVTPHRPAAIPRAQRSRSRSSVRSLPARPAISCTVVCPRADYACGGSSLPIPPPLPFDEDEVNDVTAEQPSRLVINHLKSGWKSFIALSHLTSAACADACCRESNSLSLHAEATHLTDSGGFVMKPKDVDNSKADDVTFEQLLGAMALLVAMIRMYYIPEGRSGTGSKMALHTADQFQRLFDFMQSQRNLQSNLPVYIMYINFMMECECQKRLPHFSSSIGTWQQSLFNKLTMEYQSCMIAQLRSATATVASSGQQSTRASSGQGSACLLTSQSSTSFRGKSAKHCMLCGSTKHPRRKHSGPGKFLSSVDGKWKDSAGASYCIGFNDFPSSWVVELPSLESNGIASKHTLLHVSTNASPLVLLHMHIGSTSPHPQVSNFRFPLVP